MRRLVFISLGVLELAVAAVLIYLSNLLPTSNDVHQSMGEIQTLTQQTGNQVRLAQKEITHLRQPELQASMQQLKKQLPTITAMLRNQKLNYDGLRQLKDTLASLSKGLESGAKSFTVKDGQQLSLALQTMADYFEKQIAPAAADAAERMEKATATLAKDTKALGDLLQGATPDLQAVKDIHDSLGQLSQGLTQVNGMLDVKSIAAIREGFTGIESSLNLGSQQVNRLANFTYPVVNFNGFRPEISQQPFWPQGKQIAAGMTKGAKGIAAAGKQMDQLAKELPGVTNSIKESQVAAGKTQEMLAQVLKNREKLEHVLKEVPNTTASLSKELPNIGRDFAMILRETEKLKTMAHSLREAQKRIDATVQAWPDLQNALIGSAKILTQTEQQLELALVNEKAHKQALSQTLELTEALGRLMPVMTEQLDHQLELQTQSLGQLGDSLQRATTKMPGLANGASNILDTVKWILWLFAGIVILHGIYLSVDSFRMETRSVSEGNV